jgi:hypothetical protein
LVFLPSCRTTGRFCPSPAHLPPIVSIRKQRFLPMLLKNCFHFFKCIRFYPTPEYYQRSTNGEKLEGWMKNKLLRIEPAAKVGYFCTGSCSFSG